LNVSKHAVDWFKCIPFVLFPRKMRRSHRRHCFSQQY
jgi:hypothetical protein